MILRVIQMISPILFSAAAILWVTDVISQPVFITLVIIETAITMALVIWQVRKQFLVSRAEGALQENVGVTGSSTPVE